MEKITITTVSNGYIVTAGCMQVVFESRKRMLLEIGRYLTKPAEVEKEYRKIEKGYLPNRSVTADRFATGGFLTCTAAEAPDES